MKITQYTIVSDNYSIPIVMKANDLIAQGRQPLGGLLIDNKSRYFQVMVKYEEADKQ